jgi:hypothetical protein
MGDACRNGSHSENQQVASIKAPPDGDEHAPTPVYITIPSHLANGDKAGPAGAGAKYIVSYSTRWYGRPAVFDAYSS